jgi:hypothetical protein
MILTLHKLIQKSKQVTDPRDAHALALDLVESMLRHYAVVAIAAYRHAGAKDQKINRILSEQLPRPSMGSWKNFLQMLAAANKELFPEDFREKFLGPFNRKVKEPAVSLACQGLRELVDRESMVEKNLSGKGGPIELTPLEYFDLMVAYRNRYTGHGTQTLPKANLDFSSTILNGTTALCNHLQTLWNAYPIYVSRQAALYGGKYFRFIPLVPEAPELQITEEFVVADRLYLCFGDKRDMEPVSLYPLALWQDEDLAG